MPTHGYGLDKEIPEHTSSSSSTENIYIITFTVYLSELQHL
jgi:hypothetical protein